MRKLLWTAFLILVWPSIEHRLREAARRPLTPKASRKPAARKTAARNPATRKHAAPGTGSRADGQTHAERKQRAKRSG